MSLTGFFASRVSTRGTKSTVALGCVDFFKIAPRHNGGCLKYVTCYEDSESGFGFRIWEDLATWVGPGKIALALVGSKKKVQLFGVFIGSSAAAWRADSKNVYMSIANIIASGSKMRKTSGNLQFPQNCTFPEVFQIFDPLRTIFAMDMYTFLESARQGAADEPIKTPKS